MALAIKEGKLSPNYSKRASKIAGQMTIEQLRDYCPREKG